MSKIEEQVIAKLGKRILERAEVGYKKYGTTMERDDITIEGWWGHRQEEVMDTLVYSEKMLTEIRKLKLELRKLREENRILKDCFCRLYVDKHAEVWRTVNDIVDLPSIDYDEETGEETINYKRE